MELLLEAFKKVSGFCSGLNLVIIGEREEKPELLKQSLWRGTLLKGFVREGSDRQGEDQLAYGG